MSFRSNRKKTIRKKEIIDDSDDQDTPVQKIVKKKLVKTIVHNYDEEPETMVFTKKLARAVDIKLVKQAPTEIQYDQQLLEQLRKEQLKKPVQIQVEDSMDIDPPIDIKEALIPNQNDIDLAKKRREQLRLKKEVSTEQDYISVNQTVSKISNESRLAVDEDMDIEEAFDDYKGDSIVFGERAVREATEALKQERKDLIANQLIDEDDDEILDWQLQKMNQGKKSTMDIALSNRSSTRKPKTVGVPIPAPCTLTSVEVMANLDTAIHNLTVLITEHESQIVSTETSRTESRKSIAQFKAAVNMTSTRYDYFQSLESYIVDLCELLDEKEPLIEELEDGYLNVMMAQTIEDSERRYKLLDKCSENCFRETVHPQPLKEVDARPESELEIDRLACFEDASKHFKNLRYVKEKFELWKSQYPREYDQGYGAMSLASVFDLYIRFEIVQWNPFVDTLALEEMEWHRLLADFGLNNDSKMDPNDPDSKLLSTLVEKTVIPKIRKAIMSSYDVFSPSHTANAINLVNSLLDYLSLKSDAMQVRCYLFPYHQDLLDSFEDRILDTIHEALEHVPQKSKFTFMASENDYSFKAAWLQPFLEVGLGYSHT
ncbi:hypothetical protein BC833DRAFT_572187 [Globomyces pollinis-pini]|nr:hypothetical protein BC833DRAFT_572187 [Globomyces pollinis-pini]